MSLQNDETLIKWCKQISMEDVRECSEIVREFLMEPELSDLDMELLSRALPLNIVFGGDVSTIATRVNEITSRISTEAILSKDERRVANWEYRLKVVLDALSVFSYCKDVVKELSDEIRDGIYITCLHARLKIKCPPKIRLFRPKI